MKLSVLLSAVHEALKREKEILGGFAALGCTEIKWLWKVLRLKCLAKCCKIFNKESSRI